MTHRDWIDWVVAVGGILGAFASLAAVVIAVVALRVARTDASGAKHERGWQLATYRAEALRRIYRILGEIGGASIEHRIADVSAFQRELRVLVVTANLADVLPRVVAVFELEGIDDESRSEIHRAAWVAMTEVKTVLHAETSTRDAPVS